MEKTLKFPFEVSFQSLNMFKLPFEFMQIPDAEQRGVAVALALVGISAAFLYYSNINRGMTKHLLIFVFGHI
jgi:hypothetical protein